MIERIAKETTMDSTGAYQDSGQAELKKRITTYKATSSSEKRDFMLALVGGLIRCLAMFRGDMPAQAANVYGPIGVFPVGQQTGDPQLQMSGMPELAVLTGLTGIGRTVEGWNVTLPTDNLSAGTLAIASPASPKPRRLFAVSTGEALSRLVLDGIVEEDDPNTIIAVCSAPVLRLQRNPGGSYGRADDPRCREFGLRSLVAEATSTDHLMVRFKEEATLRARKAQSIA